MYAFIRSTGLRPSYVPDSMRDAILVSVWGVTPPLDYGFLPVNLCLDPACSERQTEQNISQAPAGPHIPAFRKLASARSTQNSF